MKFRQYAFCLVLGLGFVLLGTNVNGRTGTLEDGGTKCVGTVGVCERILSECGDGSHSETLIYGKKTATIQ
jgi:hypothetical protein